MEHFEFLIEPFAFYIKTIGELSRDACTCFALLQEEVAKLNRKLERSKKIEMAGAADEVLLEEVKEYKVAFSLTDCFFFFFFFLNSSLHSFLSGWVIFCKPS